MEMAIESSAGPGITSRPNGLSERARPEASTLAPYQRISDDDRGTGGESLANFLGLFSLALGTAQMLAPEAMSKLCGIDDAEGNRGLMRTLGMREFSSGLAILGKQQPEKAVASRVVGDVLDLALLGKAMANPDNHRGRTLFAMVNVLAVTALDVMCAKTLSMQPETAANAGADAGIIRTKRSITVGASPQECFDVWADFEKLPDFMLHLESVTVLSDTRSHWTAKAPAGQTVEWDAETTELVPGERIAWRSVEGSGIYNAGTVEFMPAPGGRGTEVRVTLEYEPPFGKIASKIAMLWREEPGQQAQDDLRHFKQVMELGEVVVSDATKDKGMHPAAPDGEGASLLEGRGN